MHMGKLMPDRNNEHLPFLTEPIVGSINLQTKTSGLELLSLGPNGKVVSRSEPKREENSLVISLPAGRGTHWYVLKSRMSVPTQKHVGQSAKPKSED